MKSRHTLRFIVSTLFGLWLIASAALAAGPARARARAATTISLTPTQDTFVRENAPDATYGTAGAMSVSGAASLNGLGVPQGVAHALMQFDVSSAVSAFNSAYGVGGWVISSAQLAVTENAAPNHPIFTRGIGDFEARWLSDDNWVEGTGTPGRPGTGTGNEMTWNYLQAILPAATENSLGQFSNLLQNTRETFDLTLTVSFIADAAAGGVVSLHLVPISDSIGFTFNSNKFPDPATWPQLTLTAVSIRGDLNCDGLVNTNDIGPFAQALVDPAGYATAFPNCSALRADMNGDGLADGRDVSLFVGALLGP